jgi:hypothetical protein
MKTVSQLLRNSDPLGYEPPPSDRERRQIRQTVLNARTVSASHPRRVIANAIVVALTLGAVGAGIRYWPRGVADVFAAVRFEVRLAEDRPADGLRPATIAGRTIYLHPEPVVTNEDIVDAQLVPGEGPSPFSISVTFSPAGSEKMARASKGHVGRPVAILIDGVVVMAPVLRDPVMTSALVTGPFTKAEAERVVQGILGR